MDHLKANGNTEALLRIGHPLQSREGPVFIATFSMVTLASHDGQMEATMEPPYVVSRAFQAAPTRMTVLSTLKLITMMEAAKITSDART